MAENAPVSVLEGPKGKAEIFEIWQGGRLIEYQVRVGTQTQVCRNLGEAYIFAGEQVGTKT